MVSADGGKMRRLGISFIIVLVVGLFYQNCGKSGFENTDLSSQLIVPGSAQTTKDPKLATLPFPYEVSVNQIAHMSCVMPQSSTPFITYFSWAVGAYDNPSDVASSRLNIRTAGLKLSPNFQTQFDQVALNYNPSIRNTKLKEALLGLPSIANNQLQLSFRKTNIVRTELMAVPGGVSPVVNFLPVLSTDAIADSFVLAPQASLNYFTNVADYSQRPLEAKLRIGAENAITQAALNANYDSSQLTIGYAPVAIGTASASAPLVGPGTDSRLAYGKGFRVHFGVNNPHQGTTQYPSTDSLAFVGETDLETGNSAPVSWDCSIKMKIVRNQDRSKMIYRANHFNLVNGTCPTRPLTGPFCRMRGIGDQSYGLPVTAFPGSVCPSDRDQFNGSYCNEKYYEACPLEAYSAADQSKNPNAISYDEGLTHPNHPDRVAILHALRRFLPADQWDINVSRRCIVPKVDDNSCYSSSPIVYDEYFFNGLSVNPSLGLYGGCGVNGQYSCAAYLTMCVRR